MARRRVQPPATPILPDALRDRWQARDDPRALDLAAGRPVLLGRDELPAERTARDAADPCMGFGDDYELWPDGLLRRSPAYYGRRLAEPLPAQRWGDAR